MNTNKMSDEQISRFAKKFESEWLDEEYEPSVEKLRQKKWNTLPVGDFINAMEAEWLSDAILSTGFKQAIGLCFEYKRNPVGHIIDVNRDAVHDYITSNSFLYVCLTSLESDFLFFKDQTNRFFLLCGKQDFIERSYRCTFETAKVMYFNYWIDNDFHSKEEQQFLIRTWEKYALINR